MFWLSLSAEMLWFFSDWNLHLSSSLLMNTTVWSGLSTKELWSPLASSGSAEVKTNISWSQAQVAQHYITCHIKEFSQLLMSHDCCHNWWCCDRIIPHGPWYNNPHSMSPFISLRPSGIDTAMALYVAPFNPWRQPESRLSVMWTETPVSRLSFLERLVNLVNPQRENKNCQVIYCISVLGHPGGLGVKVPTMNPYLHVIPHISLHSFPLISLLRRSNKDI